MKLVKLLGLGVLGIIIGCLAAEVAARIFLPYPRRQIDVLRMRAPDLQLDAQTDLNHLNFNPFIQRRPHSEWVCDGKTSEIMNNEGFRDRDFIVEKTEGLKRIAFIGDSFTEGWMAKKGAAFPFVVGKEMGGSYEVMNFGLANRSPLRYLSLYHQIVHTYNPDIVVVCLYSNDIAEDENLLPYTKFNAYGVPVEFDFQRYFRNTPRMPQTKREKLNDKIQWFFCKYFRLYPYAAVYFMDPEFRKRTLESPPKQDLDQWWNNTARYLQTLQDLVTADDSQLFLTYAPDLKDFKTEDPVHRHLVEYARNQQIDVFLADDFLKEKNPQRLYIEGDGHFNPLGHEVFGKQLAEWLKPRIKVR